MDGRGSCCIARYSRGGGGGGGGAMSYGMSKVEKIMLKFRPIAPKPLAAGSGSSCSTMDNSDGCGGAPRRKRKYVRVSGNKKKNHNNNTSTVSKKQKVSSSSNSVSGGGDAVVTLSLMPETPDRKENRDLLSVTNRNKLAPVCYDGHVLSVTDHAVAIASNPQRSEHISFVTVECVAETWLNDDVLGFRDEARVRSMEMDTCPSFITNSCDVVVWTNKAYREMTVGGGGGGGGDETAAVVVKKFNRVVMPVAFPAFTCKVKVTWGGGLSSVTAPCDVWRLQSGGYAWRLDVNAALCLGR